MKTLLFIILTLFLTGCAQFAPKANYQVEVCERTFDWNEEKRRQDVIWESCTKSFAESNRESKNVALKYDPENGGLDFQAGELTNAPETAWAQAIAELLKDPEAVQATVNVFKALLTGGK